MGVIEKINFALLIVFFVCYAYQFFYIPVSLFVPKKRDTSVRPFHKLAVLICGKNEEAVIGHLIDSIKAANYPKDMIDVFVCADNCTDNTKGVAEAAGARHVYERFSNEGIGKGYALKFMLSAMAEDGFDDYEAYVVLDADNVVDPEFFTEMNREFDNGYPIVTSYRNSKNYADDWVSAGYALWFLREARYLSRSRKILGSSCAVSGTGFLFSKQILEDMGGTWNYFLLTEDIEFSIVNISKGIKIGYAEYAVIYDEQPTSFRVSFRQRLRWCRGYYQVFKYHGKELFSGLFHGSWACYDMAMNLCPAAILSLLTIGVNIAGVIINLSYQTDLRDLLWSVGEVVVKATGTVFLMGLITVITEWKQIHARSYQKILYMFTFPIFILTYIPVAVAGLFVNPGWKPIAHTKSVSLDEAVAKKKKKK